MPVIGWTIKSIVAERRNPVTDRLNINISQKIISVEEREIELASKQTSLAIGFEFESSYSPDIGNMKFTGELLYVAKNEKNIINYWNKEGKLPDGVDREIVNFLLQKCLTLGINISEEIQLPPPIAFPTIRSKNEEQTKYIG